MPSENEPMEKKPVPTKLSFGRICDPARPKIKGKLNMTTSEITWSAEKGGRIISVPKSEVEAVQWSPLGKDSRLRIYMPGDAQVSFRGFSATDFNKIKPFFEEHFDRKAEILQINTSGHNYGKVDFKGSVLRHFRGNRCTFELPLTSVSQSMIQGKNEISLLFHDDDAHDDADEVLTEMRIYVPPNEDEEEDETEATKALNDEIIDRAGIRVNVKDSITKLESLMFTTPRGKHDVEFYKSFFRLHGSSSNYKIMYTRISKLFLFPSADRMHHLFVVGLDPPIRQGRTHYRYLVMQIKNENQSLVELNMEEDDIKNAGNIISKNMSDSTYEITWRLFKALSKRKVAIPSKKFSSSQDLPCISCSLKANFGHLYILKKSFFFVHKPPTWITHDQIESVEFARLQSTGTGRVFDIKLTMIDQSEYLFTNINKDEYHSVFRWINESSLKIANIRESKNAATRSRSGRAAARETDYSHDSYAAALQDEVDDEDEDEDEDEDFSPGGDESSDAEDYDSNVEDSDEEEDEDVRGKRKAKSKAKAAKKAKSEPVEDDERSKKGAASPASKLKSPKKNRSAFVYFSQDKRMEVKEENPDKSRAEIGKILGDMWKDLEDDEKKPYEDRASKDLTRYRSEKKKYEEEGGGPTKKRKRKDKNAPKAAKSAFTLFSQANRKKIQDANPDKKFGEISKLVGAEWQKLSLEDKEPYIENAKKDKLRAAEEKAKYDEEHKDDPVDDDEDTGKKRKRKKIPGQPKRAKSAYLFFTQKNRANVVEMNPEAKSKDIMVKLGEKWRGLTPDDKKEYEVMAGKDKERYESEMSAFKKKQKNKEKASMEVEDEDTRVKEEDASGDDDDDDDDDEEEDDE